MNLRRFRKAEKFNEFVTWCLIVAFIGGQLALPPTAKAGGPGTTTVSAGTAPTPAATTVESFQPDLFTGRATTSLPIEAPPGRQGVQPSLGIGYSSSSQNGLLGVGWSIGMGYIERSTRVGVPAYNDSTDVFTFQIQGISSDLVKIGDGTYRAEVEGAFMKFTFLGAAGWEVRDKSGTRYLFGRSTSSQMANGSKIFRWCLDRVIDVNGNTMDYAYASFGGQPYPSQIDYTGHTNGLAPANRVTFTWEDRPDTSRSLRTGWEIQSPKRLAKIETYATVSNALSMAARYVFGYGVSARTGRSLLTSFQKFGTDGVTSLPPMTFTYQSDAAPTYDYKFTSGKASFPAWNVQQANMEGNNNFGCISPYSGLGWSSPIVASGWTDLTGSKYLNVNSSGGFEMQGTEDWFIHAWTYVYSPTSSVRSFSSANHATEGCLWVEDATGMHGPYPFGSLYNIPFAAGWAILHVTGYNVTEGPWSLNLYNSLVTEFAHMAPAASTQPQMTGDVDGNGITDLIQFKDGNWTVSRAYPDRIDPPGSPWLSGFGSPADAPMLGDWNADGRVDMGLSAGGTWNFTRSTGSNFVANPIPSYPFSGGTPFSGDFNGDGITDLGLYSTGKWRIAVGSGTGFVERTSFNITQPSDYIVPSNKVAWHALKGSMYDPCEVPPPDVDWGPVANLSGSGYLLHTDYSSGRGIIVTSFTYSVSSGGGISYTNRYSYYLRTHVFNASNRTVALRQEGGWGWGRACLWVQDSAGLRQLADDWTKPVQTSTVTLAVGWSTFHLLASYGYPMTLSDLLPQVDAMNVDKPAAQKDIQSFVTGDFNGDGLTDVGVIRKGNLFYPAFSDGTTFVQQPAWPISFGSNEYVTADFNGDGLTDVAYFDRTTGRIKVGTSTGSGIRAPVELPVTFGLRTKDDQIQLGEFNGDGLPDLAIFNPIGEDAEIGRSAGTAPDLLVGILNGLGGTSAIKYQATTSLSNTYLPMVMQVVTESITSDGLGNTYKTTFSYQDGLYDSVTREIRGFGHVEMKDAEGVRTITDFHQDANRKGKAYRNEVRDSAGNLWTRTDSLWTSVTPYAGYASSYARVERVDVFDYDGNATAKQKRTRFAYDAYGNTTASYMDGEMSGDVNVPGDERSNETTYTVNTNAWILDKVAETRQRDAAGQIVSQMKFYYDGATDTATMPVIGQLTRSESWLDRDRTGALNRWVPTTFTYDVYGNVLTVTDELYKSLTHTYDASQTYLSTTVNAAGHVRTMVYDPRHAAVVRGTDPNGAVTSTEFDPLGRVTKVIGPLDTPALPTKRFEYDYSTNPSRVSEYTRVLSGQTKELVSHTFTDSLGRKIQVRGPAQDPAKHVVTGTVEFDAKGQVARQWTAYLDDASTSYRPHTLPAVAAVLAPPASYTYDPLGRLRTSTRPDLSVESTDYDDWTVVKTDASGHIKKHTLDGLGRIPRVMEFTGTGDAATLYSTTEYQYDTRDNIVFIRDNAGNTTSLSYDSLNRKISMASPDQGTWTYAYDDRGSLVAQTDARNVCTIYTYDDLERPTRKDYVVPSGINVPTNMPSVIYAYDNPAKPLSRGRLTEISDSSGSVDFTHDALGRIVVEKKTVDGQAYVYQRGFDLIGRLISLTYPNGHVATYVYNDQGGMKTVSLRISATVEQNIISAATYNAASQITRITYGNGVTTDYTYNPKTLKIDTLKSVGPGGVIQDFTYHFDASGNVTGIDDAVNSATQTFGCDSLNRLTSASGARYGNLAYVYDVLGNMTAKEGVTQTYGPVNNKPHAVMATSAGLALTYDANGNLATKTGPGRPSQQFTFDAENRLIQVDTVNAINRLVTGWNFVSFPKTAGEVPVSTAITNFATTCAQLSRYNATNKLFESFVNNASFNQFTTISASNGYCLFVTNASGVEFNLNGAAAPVGARTMAAGSHLLPGPARAMSVSNWLTGLVAGVDYSDVRGMDQASGSVTNVAGVSPGRAYYVNFLRSTTWTPPSIATVDTTNRVRFVYDGDGGRVKKITAKGETLFIGQGYEVSPEQIVTTYVLAGGLRIAARESNGNLRFYHSDHLGSANVITDQGGSVVELTENTPYGSISRREGPVNVAHKFTGQRLDDETGLYYFSARYYDPEIGRFISPDTLMQDGLNPQVLNSYTYGGNNPLVYTDPSGHFVFMVVLGAIAWNALVGVGISLIIQFGVGLATGLSGGGWKALGDMWTVQNFASTVVSSIATAGVGAALGGVAGGTRGVLNGMRNLPGFLKAGTMGRGILEGMASALAGSTVGQAVANGGKVDWSKVGVDVLVSGAVGGIKNSPVGKWINDKLNSRYGTNGGQRPEIGRKIEDKLIGQATKVPSFDKAPPSTGRIEAYNVPSTGFEGSCLDRAAIARDLSSGTFLARYTATPATVNGDWVTVVERLDVAGYGASGERMAYRYECSSQQPNRGSTGISLP